MVSFPRVLRAILISGSLRVNKLSFVEANTLCSCLGANDFNEIISSHLVKICYYRFKKARRKSWKAP